MKHCLSQGFPFACGIAVYASFQSEAVAASGIIPMPQPGEDCDGGHEVSIVGYNDATQMFILRNSWGDGWGQAGYCMIPYNYLLNMQLASEFVTVRK
jgi:C1A family cysteine protease